MAVEEEKKWEGTVRAKLTSCSAGQIWPLLEDFFNFHKWVLPTIDTCHGIEGTSGQPGCIRYCSRTLISGDGSGEMVTRWAHEKLLTIDPIEMSLSYEVIENNAGLNPLVATIKLLPFSVSEGDGCEIIWSFAVKPMEGWNLNDLVSVYNSTIQIMAERMDEAVQTTKQCNELHKE